jgi:hypothetical protein
MPELCRICHARRPKRHCPGVEGDICSLCCGDQREVNISCPLECPHLQDARQHEKPFEFDRSSVPNKDIRLTEDFIREHDELILFCLFTLADGALRTPGAVDSDVLKAVAALIRTYRTRESGLEYETKADDRVAAAVQEHFERSMKDFQQQRKESAGLSPYRDAEILGGLAFAERTAFTQQNGRPRGRAFIDYTRQRLNIPMPQTAPSVLVS